MVKQVGTVRRGPTQESKKFIFCLSEQEYQEIKIRSLKKNMSAGMWVRRAIQAQIQREMKYE